MADNPDELFDIVDGEDRVIGKARRADVHAQGLLHRAVHLLVQRSDGAVFLQRRSLQKDSQPGKWDSSASGHLDAGEEYAAAARRELVEELGIVAEPAEIGRLSASRETGQEFVRIYRVEHEGPFTLHPEEIMDGGWFTPQEVAIWIQDKPETIAPCFAAVWREAKSRLACS